MQDNLLEKLRQKRAAENPPANDAQPAFGLAGGNLLEALRQRRSGGSPVRDPNRLAGTISGVPIYARDIESRMVDVASNQGIDAANNLFAEARQAGRALDLLVDDEEAPVSEQVILTPSAFERVSTQRTRDEAINRARQERESGFFAAAGRVGEAIAEPFQNLDERSVAAGRTLGFAPESDELMVQRFPQIAGQAAVTAGMTGLSALEAATQGVGQLLEETLGIPAAEATEFLDIAGLAAGANPAALTRGAARSPRAEFGPSAERRRLLEGQETTETREGRGPIRSFFDRPSLEAEQRAIREQQEFIAQARDAAPAINLDLGAINLSQRQQAILEDARAGMLGERAQAIAEEAVRTQNEALVGGIEDIRRRATRRARPTTTAGEGFEETTDAIRNEAQRLKRRIDDAYDNARETGDAYVPSELVEPQVREIVSSLSDAGFNLNSPRLAAKLQELESFRDLSPRSIKDMERWRRRVGRDIQSVKMSDPAEAEALRRMQRSVDEFLGQTLDAGLLRGDERALEVFKEARALRREFGKRFEGDRFIERIVDDNLTQEEALNSLLGMSTVGFKNAAGRNIARIKSAIGEDNPAIDGIRQEFFFRLLRNQNGEYLSGAKFRSALDKIEKDNPSVVRELFDRNQMRELRRFASVADRVTSRLSGTRNTSGTAAALVRAIGRIPFLGNVLTGTAGLVGDAYSAQRGAQQVREMLNVENLRASVKRDPELLARTLAVGIGANNDR